MRMMTRTRANQRRKTLHESGGLLCQHQSLGALPDLTCLLAMHAPGRSMLAVKLVPTLQNVVWSFRHFAKAGLVSSRCCIIDRKKKDDEDEIDPEEVKKNLERLSLARKKREEDRQRRIVAEGWDRHDMLSFDLSFDDSVI